MRVYADRLVVVAEATVLAEHARVFSRDHRSPGKTIYDWRHYLAVAQRKPSALRNGAPFKTLPDSFQQLQRQLLKRQGGDDREMINILALVLLHDEHLVERAVTLALAAGHPSKEHELNCLSRLTDKPLPEPLKPPPALTLVTEPAANTARYDNLREVRHGR